MVQFLWSVIPFVYLFLLVFVSFFLFHIFVFFFLIFLILTILLPFRCSTSSAATITWQFHRAFVKKKLSPRMPFLSAFSARSSMVYF